MSRLLPAPRISWKSALSILMLAVMVGIAGCAKAPATGRTIFTGGLTPEKEKEIGQEQYRQIREGEVFGGPYREHPELTRYVASIGQLLASTSEMPNLEWTFTVLDTPIVNAFATPGGYIYITRGLVALAANEAELAGVLAHEIGHVTARHSAERYGQSILGTIAVIGAGVALGGGPETQALGQVTGALLRSYSRDQEFEADTLGVRYLARAGYEPSAMSTFLEKLQAHSRLEATLRGDPEAADRFSIMQTHPRTADRVVRAIQVAGAKTVPDPIVARDIYLDKIDGIIYGDSPEQGLIRGRRFLHPKLRFAFEVPPGFQLFNSAERVAAMGPDGAGIIFDLARVDGDPTAHSFLTRQWAQGVRLNNVERITVNGMETATGWVRRNTNQGPRDLRLVAYRYEPGLFYRFIFVTRPNPGSDVETGLRRTTYSFRKLSAGEAAALEPYRLDIVRVRSGDTVSGFARLMPYPDYRELRFRVLNGLDQGDYVRAGERVKLVRE